MQDSHKYGAHYSTTECFMGAAILLLQMQVDGKTIVYINLKNCSTRLLTYLPFHPFTTK